MLVMTIILAVLLLLANIYLLAYYCHPDDRGFGSALICKIVVVIGMSLSWAQVLMLPLDVSNSRGFDSAIRMDLFWQIVYLATAAMIVFVIPLLTHIYEADPEWSCWERTKYSLCYFFATVIVVIVILIVSYAFLSTAEIPIAKIYCGIAQIQKSDNSTLTHNSLGNLNCWESQGTIEVDVSFPIYVIGFMSFISWFLFVLFGGVGLPALPLDFIYDFCTRPKTINKSDMEGFKNKVASRALLIKELAAEAKELEKQQVMKNSMFNKDKRKYKEILNKVGAGVIVLEKDYQLICIQEDLNDSWVCQYYFGFVLGVFCLFISFAWLVHM